MAGPMHLFDLFPNLESEWPYHIIPAFGPPDPSITWLHKLNDALHISDLRTGTSSDQVSFSCRCQIVSGDEIEFRINSISHILFKVLGTFDTKQVNLFVDLRDRGAEIIIEGLPVEILIPPDLIYGDPVFFEDEIPSGEEPSDLIIGLTTQEVEEAKAAFQTDPHGQFVILRNDYSDAGGATSVYTHLRLHITPDFEIKLTTAAPISFGRCGFLGLPVIAIHDFQLIPSPHLSYSEDRKLLDKGNWIRHNLWIPNDGAGAFAMRSIEFDFESGYFKKALPEDKKRDVKAEWVFEDIIFPFSSGPVPIHFTLGFRRNIDNFNDVTDVMSFEQAAASFFLLKMLTVRINKFYLRTIPLEDYAVDANVDLGFTWGDNDEEGEDQIPWEISVQWDENFTLRVGLALLPKENEGEWVKWLRWRFSDKIIVRPIRILPGYSFGKMQQRAPFKDSFDLTASFWIHDKDAIWNPDGTGSSNENGVIDTDEEPPKGKSPVSIKSPPNKPFSMLVTDIGYRQGSFYLNKFSLPEGYSPRIGPVQFDLFELGIVNEDDATYFSISGGVQFSETKKYEGGIWFKRMRFRIGGNENADFFKLDGFSGRLAVKNKMELEFGGYFTDETNIPLNFHKEEFGFTGKLAVNLASQKLLFAADLIAGKLRLLDTGDAFNYFMFQFFANHIPLGSCELHNLRLIVSHEMAPNLTEADLAQDQMKYYHWQKSIDPLTIPGNRRLQGWKVQKDAFSLGIGAAITCSGGGDTFRWNVFCMYIDSPADAEKGFLIAVELFFGKPSNSSPNPDTNQRTPIAWGILEYDLNTDICRVQLGINLTLDAFVPNAPAVLSDVFKIKGTIFFTNKPWTLAIGRIDDQNSWFMVLYDWDLFSKFKSYVMIAFCAEFVEGGTKGIGAAIRVEGGIDMGFFGISYYAGILFIWRSFVSGSSDFVVLASASIGCTVKLFWVIHFGLDILAEVRHVGYTPTYTGALVRIRINTSWWLPNISWNFEINSGEIDPAERAMVAAPLASASSLHAATGKSTALFIESIATGLFSLSASDNMVIPEAMRLQRFRDAIRTATNPLQPIATDSTIVLQFSNPVYQSLGIGPVDDEWGEQLTGDDENYMKLRYALTAISVRRRPRFGANRIWTMMETHREMEIISPETGEVIGGSITFEHTSLSYLWDADVQENGKTVPVKLLINSDTPFSFSTDNTEADENIISENPEWPCCRKSAVNWHWYYFRDENTGILDRQRRRKFHLANGFEIITADGFIAPKKLSATSDPVHVATFYIRHTKQVMRMVFDEDAIAAGIYVNANFKDKATLTLTAENAHGEVVLVKTHEFSARPSGWEFVTITGRRFRSVTIVAEFYKREWILFADIATWLSATDYIKNQVGKKSCATENPNRGTDFSGNGSIFFLPNHEYEISMETEMSVRHNSTEWETRTCKEFAYFITKGLPGLNYTKNIGAEIAPYVQSQYPLMRPFIYAEEPVTLVLNEKFKLSLPISTRRPGDLDEHIQLLNLKLFVKPNSGKTEINAADEQPVDWITAKAQSRSLSINGDPRKWIIRSKTTDPRLNRLSNLRAVSSGTGCTDTDVSIVNQSVLAVFPSDRTIDGQKYWNSGIECSAYLQLDQQIYINHAAFVDSDLAAFNIGTHPTGEWSIHAGKLMAREMASLALAQFGEADWNYFSLATEIQNLDGEAGFVIGKNNAPGSAYYVLVSNVHDDITLKVYRTYPSDVAAEFHYAFVNTIQLRVLVYDDVLAISMNNENCTVPRIGSGSGFCAFAVQGSASFKNIYAEPLPMYAFNFRVSRFNSFKAHIENFEDQLFSSILDLDFQTARTVLQPLIEKTMTTLSSDAEREALFVKFAATGRIFVGENINKSRITALTTSGNNCLALLVESIESLDIATGELKLELARKWIFEETNPISGITGLEEILAAAKESAGGLPLHSNFLNEFVLPGIIEIEGLNRIETRLNGLRGWSFTPLISKINVTKGATKNELSIFLTYGSSMPLLAGKSILFLQYSAINSELKIYTCIRVSKRKLTATLTESVSIRVPRSGAGLHKAKGIQLLVIPEDNLVIYGEATTAGTEWRDTDIAVIQNHNASKLLLMPRDIEAIIGPGDWKLSFVLNRTRYSTLDTTDTLSQYKDKGDYYFTIPS